MQNKKAESLKKATAHAQNIFHSQVDKAGSAWKAIIGTMYSAYLCGAGELAQSRRLSNTTPTTQIKGRENYLTREAKAAENEREKSPTSIPRQRLRDFLLFSFYFPEKRSRWNRYIYSAITDAD